MKSRKKHWEDVYHSTPTDQLGWFESHPEPTIELLKQCSLTPESRILTVGSGTSTFVDYLLDEGFRNLIATDISAPALEQLKARVGEQQQYVDWLVDDLTNPTFLNQLEPIDLWHDRAVLHFFTEEQDQESYFNLLKQLVKSNGFVLIAVFSLEGAQQCSGLPIKNYSAEMLQEKLGSEFRLIQQFQHLYTTPGGNPRDYIYTLFQRT